MKTFEQLLEEIHKKLAWESIPADETIAEIARICGPAEIDLLIQELEDLDDADIADQNCDVWDDYCRHRRTLSRILGQIGEPAVDPLLRVLQSTNPQTRHYAAAALGVIGAIRAFEPIVRAAALETDNFNRVSVLSALGGLGDQRAIAVLLPYLQVREQRNRGWIIRLAAKALGGIGNEQVVQSLAEILGNDPDWFARLGAVEGLEQSCHQQSTEALTLALNDVDYRVRDAAREGLRKLAYLSASQL